MSRINTNIQSLLASRVLGKNNNALNQALTRLSTGLRINTGEDDPAGFAEAVVRLLQDAPLRRRLGQAARQDMLSRRAWEHLAETAEAAYGGRE